MLQNPSAFLNFAQSDSRALLYYLYILCEPSIFEKVIIWFLGQPVVWSEPNISQIEAWSSSIYAWYQEFEFDFCLNIFFNFKQKWQKFKNLN
jgi:hypothetical protein